MGGFLYYRAGAGEPTLALAREWGLGYAFVADPVTRMHAAGPRNCGQGWVFCDGKRLPDRCSIDEDRQFWRRIPGLHQDIWLGYWLDAPPQPEELARPELLAGWTLRAADGRYWKIPLVRMFNVETAGPDSALPSFMTLDDRGYLTRGRMKEAYRWLWDLTEASWQAMIKGEPLSQQECVAVAAGVFQANYAVGATELAVMDVYDEDIVTPSGVVALAVDYKTFRDWSESQKKTKPDATGDGSNTNGLLEGAATTMAQPVLNS